MTEGEEHVSSETTFALARAGIAIAAQLPDETVEIVYAAFAASVAHCMKRRPAAAKLAAATEFAVATQNCDAVRLAEAEEASGRDGNAAAAAEQSPAEHSASVAPVAAWLGSLEAAGSVAETAHADSACAVESNVAIAVVRQAALVAG